LLPVVPAVVCAEWWRGRSGVREDILAAMIVEDMPPLFCRAAGEALGAIRGSSLAHAVVMASAALRGGGVVYTADVDDLRRLQRHFSYRARSPGLSLAHRSCRSFITGASRSRHGAKPTDRAGG
jgi:hypothetical protein